MQAGLLDRHPPLPSLNQIYLLMAHSQWTMGVGSEKGDVMWCVMFMWVDSNIFFSFSGLDRQKVEKGGEPRWRWRPRRIYLQPGINNSIWLFIILFFPLFIRRKPPMNKRFWFFGQRIKKIFALISLENNTSEGEHRRLPGTRLPMTDQRITGIPVCVMNDIGHRAKLDFHHKILEEWESLFTLRTAEHSHRIRWEKKTLNLIRLDRSELPGLFHMNLEISILTCQELHSCTGR